MSRPISLSNDKCGVLLTVAAKVCVILGGIEIIEDPKWKLRFWSSLTFVEVSETPLRIPLLEIRIDILIPGEQNLPNPEGKHFP